MFDLFSRSKKSNIVGIQFLPTGVAVSEVCVSGKKKGMIQRHEFIDSVGQQAQTDAIKTWVKQNKAEKKLCHCIVSDGDYNVYQVEQPQVEDAELLETLKWKIKDLLSFDVENAVIDYFKMPDSTKNLTKQMNVVAANESTIGAYVDIVKESGLAMNVIDINELILVNLLSMLDDNEQTVAIITLEEKVGHLYIFKEKQLYVVRDFKTGLSQLKNAEEVESVYDAILLEIQRSVDYFESYYGLGGISKLILEPKDTSVERMANYLQNYINFEIDFLTPGMVSEYNQSLEFDHRCFKSFCAALRGIQ